ETATVSFGSDAPADKGDAISLYPNPASDYVKLDVTDNVESYRVLNTVGQLLIDKQVNGEDIINVNTERYEPGTYMVQFITNDGDVVTKRFVLVK
ncbi:MAG: T9SS type A sorting domain-containing protein, partial [Bacteroidales bacterium]|nr:T9SS type A sorting domain-containing protein [Bacteroidales bacterium]